MRGLRFLLPSQFGAASAAPPEPMRTGLDAALARAHVVGLDRLPGRTRCERQGQALCFQRDSAEGGSLRVPWHVDGFGEVFLRTANLMQTETPYRLDVELARGQLNQVRNQCAEWELEGFVPSPDWRRRLAEAQRDLRRAIVTENGASEGWAAKALSESLWLAEDLTHAWAMNAIQRRRDQGQADRQRIAVALDPGITEPDELASIADCFGAIAIPIDWPTLEPRQGNYRWERLDRQISWCAEAKIPFSVGPLVDFRRAALPAWLWRWRDNPRTFSTLLIDLVESCVGRYRGRVAHWETTQCSNSTDLPGFGEEQILWVTRQLVEAAHDVDPYSSYSLGVDQPWGEYLARRERSYCPFSFLDALSRVDLPLSAVTLEVAMGFAEDSSYCRSLMDFAQLLDVYQRLDMPLRVRLGYPSGIETRSGSTSEGNANENDGGAPERPRGGPTAGQWRGPPSPALQADWLEGFVAVALAKPGVEKAIWSGYRDGAGGIWPKVGLVDADGSPKPALERIRRFAG